MDELQFDIGSYEVINLRQLLDGDLLACVLVVRRDDGAVSAFAYEFDWLILMWQLEANALDHMLHHAFLSSRANVLGGIHYLNY